MSLVLDSSVTLAWVYGDEATQPVHDVLLSVVSGGAWVPQMWRLEVANILEMGVRRGRYAEEARDRSLADLALLPIAVDGETDRHAWGPTLRLAHRHGLTLYDACYLDVALRRALPLATLDRELRAAATGEGVVLLGL
jgi:predicted nucleic acid-binding protein